MLQKKQQCDHNGCTCCLQIEAHIGEEVAAAYAMVSDVLDFDQLEEGMLVARGVCEPLDEMKATYEALPDFLTHVVEAELARVPPHIARRNMGSASPQLWSVVYLPQVMASVYDLSICC
jgi:hypothetical protein